jgi:hypothetical protein
MRGSPRGLTADGQRSPTTLRCVSFLKLSEPARMPRTRRRRRVACACLRFRISSAISANPWLTERRAEQQRLNRHTDRCSEHLDQTTQFPLVAVLADV